MLFAFRSSAPPPRACGTASWEVHPLSYACLDCLSAWHVKIPCKKAMFLLRTMCHTLLSDRAAGSLPELNLGLVMYIILGVATALKLVSRCPRKCFNSTVCVQVLERSYLLPVSPAEVSALPACSCCTFGARRCKSAAIAWRRWPRTTSTTSCPTRAPS